MLCLVVACVVMVPAVSLTAPGCVAPPDLGRLVVRSILDVGGGPAGIGYVRDAAVFVYSRVGWYLRGNFQGVAGSDQINIFDVIGPGELLHDPVELSSGGAVVRDLRASGYSHISGNLPECVSSLNFVSRRAIRTEIKIPRLASVGMVSADPLNDGLTDFDLYARFALNDRRTNLELNARLRLNHRRTNLNIKSGRRIRIRDATVRARVRSTIRTVFGRYPIRTGIRGKRILRAPVNVGVELERAQ